MVLYSVLFLGLIFAVRTRLDLAFVGEGNALYYLSNMPSVLFAAIYFAGKGIERFTGQSCRFCIARIAHHQSGDHSWCAVYICAEKNIGDFCRIVSRNGHFPS